MVPSRRPRRRPLSQSRGGGRAVQLKAALRGQDYATQVQMLAPDAGASGGKEPSVKEAASHGMAGSGGALPYADRIQKSFGGYDISNVQAYSDTHAREGSAMMGASAYATGNSVVLGMGGTDLHTVAHEAAHVVQQRAGVSLSGGVGKAGDPYERHADAVADLVVQGKSAEGLLGEMAGGGSGVASGAVQKQEPPKEVRDATAAELERAPLKLDNGDVDYETEIELSFKNIAAHGHTIFRNQQQACHTLKETAGKEDPPGFFADALMTTVELALVAATGGIGARVAVGVTGMLTAVAIDPARSATAIKVITDVAKDSTKAAIKKITSSVPNAVGEAVGIYPESDPERAAKICFSAQQRALIAAAHEAELSYNLGFATLKRQGKAGLDAARALENALAAQVGAAEAAQRLASIQEWANYQARASRGTHKKDPERVRMGVKGEDDDRGVLKLKGTWFSGERPLLTSARMEGMNAALRPDIARTMIQDLQVPIEVDLEIGQDLNSFEEWWMQTPQKHVRLSRDNKGGVELYARCDSQEAILLARQARVPTQKYLDDKGRSREDVDRQATARTVFERMGVLRPPLD